MVENKLEWSKHSKKILNTLIKENDNSIGDKELKRVMNFIMENYTENISIEELKNIVGLIELCCVCGEYGIDGINSKQKARELIGDLIKLLEAWNKVYVER